MRNIFNDESLEKEFEKNGFVRVPFLNSDEVNELKELFFSTLPSSGGQIKAEETGVEDANFISYDFTFIDKNIDYKREVFKLISSRFENHMNRLLANYRPIIANYIRKKSATGEVPLHQNWAFADEEKCTTVSIWCPLVDSTKENGTLQVVPGSHKRFGKYRGPMVPWELDKIKSAIIDNYLTPLETKAGECVILDDSIVHYSAINKTEGLRLAIQLICVPKEIPSLHYHMDQSNDKTQIKVLQVEDDFYMEFNPWKKPENIKEIGSKVFSNRQLSEKEFDKRLNGKEFYSKGIISQLLNMFKSN